MPQPQRPGSVTVTAVFLFIYSFFGFCCNGVDLAGLFPGGQMITQGNQSFDWTAEVSKHAPYYVAVAGLKAGLGLVFAASAVAAALGLLFLKQWARYLAMAWAAGYLMVGLLSVVYDFAVLIPAKLKVQETMAKASSSITLGRPVFVAMSVFSAVFMLFPVVLFFLVNGKSVQRAFAGLPPEDGPHREDDRLRARRREFEEEEEDDRPRSRRRRDEEDDDEPRRRRGYDRD